MYFSFKRDDWEWLEAGQDDDLKSLLSNQTKMKTKWFKTLENSELDVIGNTTAIKGEEALWGRITYDQNVHEKNENRTFAFFLNVQTLLTSELDRTLFPSEAMEELEGKMKQADNAVQAFIILLNTILHKFLEQLDKFECGMRDLIWELKNNNSSEVLERIAESKHELIVWNNLIIPLVEIQMTVSETFEEEHTETAEYKRLCTRLERIRMLIYEYRREVEALTDMESLVSNHRGNEIMKTLTVITTIFTPAAVFGAIWGMNFKSIPEFEWAHGYAFSLAVIISSTLGLYIYLKKKGWMGEILKTGSKNRMIR
ncbi:magnesium transporter CorA family protein [Sporosarcina koreensis]|uniref:magnesium transporter CorA family protein n=1 Tax=Sporosarcina koreensis TaxID=334735 RepID=UPI0005906BE5|nr:magnesium transporter CorA family protein [Sporosarcina koreensis]